MRKIFSSRILLAAVVVASVLTGCDKGNDVSFKSFTFDSIKGEAVIDAKKHTVTATAECGTNLADIVPDFALSIEGATATIGGVEQISGKTSVNFTQTVTYTLTSAEGESVEWKVSIKLSDDCEGAGSLEAATVYYVDCENNKHWLTFDHYGKRMRVDWRNQEGEFSAMIYDELTDYYAVWSGPDIGWYSVSQAYASNLTIAYLANSPRYVAMFANWSWVPGATITTETIAGQTCTVYKVNGGDDAYGEYGVWAGTVVLRITEGDCLYEAKWAHVGALSEGAFSGDLDLIWQ
ncbi:MAG: hypothetical protein LBR36_05160 [Bacteroidales bacterium]|jgi:hypothetical protein|nr:hypothetical protein [Bacteroidales bacterium]